MPGLRKDVNVDNISNNVQHEWSHVMSLPLVLRRMIDLLACHRCATSRQRQNSMRYTYVGYEMSIEHITHNKTYNGCNKSEKSTSDTKE